MFFFCLTLLFEYVKYIHDSEIKNVLKCEANTDQNCLPWPGLIVTTCMSYLRRLDAELTNYHRLEELREGQMEEKTREEMPVPVSYQPPRILAEIHLG